MNDNEASGPVNIGPYRTSEEKPEQSIHEVWAEMWCAQRHTDDLQLLVNHPDSWHPAIKERLFKDKAETRAAIPAAARNELRRRGVAVEGEQ